MTPIAPMPLPLSLAVAALAMAAAPVARADDAAPTLHSTRFALSGELRLAREFQQPATPGAWAEAQAR